MNLYDPQAQMNTYGQNLQAQSGPVRNPYGMPASSMATNPYIVESQQLPMGAGGRGGNPAPYMQNTGDQMQSQQMAAQNLAQVQSAIGRSAGGSAGDKAQVTPQARADALRSMGNTAGDYANQANTASGNKYDTGFGSEQSRMLAAQEAGTY